jgi:glutamate-ammonia-ligase adenylyltransferase
MRLRPSGNAGPVATSLGSFLRYQRESAWTWERLALTRARIPLTDPGFGQVIEAGIDEVLEDPREPGKVIGDALDMRARLARDRPPRHPFDLKLVPGGLMDLEFVAQSGQLLARRRIAAPQAPTAGVLACMGKAGLLPEAERLVSIHELYSTVLQVMSAALANPFKEEGWTASFRVLLARLTNYPSFERLRDDIAAMQEEVQAAARGWYERAREW